MRYGSLEYRPQWVFSYRFAVRPGQATYIGELEPDLGEPDAYQVTVEDRSERDRALLSSEEEVAYAAARKRGGRGRAGGALRAAGADEAIAQR